MSAADTLQDQGELAERKKIIRIDEIDDLVIG